MARSHPNVKLLAHLRQRIGSPIRRLRSLDAYALWAENYPPFPHNRLMEIEQNAMLRLMPDLKGRHVLDVACGSGRYGLIAAQHGASIVIGTDNSAPMLKTGLIAGVGYPLLQSTMIALPFKREVFDVIICALATGHLPPDDMWRTMRELARLLTPNGAILISDFHPTIYAKGRRRTFTAADGKQYEVEHYPHTLADYEMAARHVNLRISETLEAEAEIKGENNPVILAMCFNK